jgi:hypothetical protein
VLGEQEHAFLAGVGPTPAAGADARA